MSQKIKKYLISFLPIIVATLLIVSITYAWTEPTATPPNDNVAAPINVSHNEQTLDLNDTNFVKHINTKTKTLNIKGALGVTQGIFSTKQNAHLGLSSTAKIGIGTDYPGHKLTISGGYLTSSLTGNAGQIHIAGGNRSPNSGQIIWGDSTGWKLHFGTRTGGNPGNFKERLTISDKGLVGIGTNEPEATLDLRKVVNMSDNPRVANVGGLYIDSNNENVSPAIVLSSQGIFSGTTGGGALYLGHASDDGHGATTAKIGDSVIGSTRRLGDTGNTNTQPAKLIFATGAAGAGGIPESQIARMTITSVRSINSNDMVTGIGINTTEPEATLDIRNVKSASGNAKVKGVGGIYVTSNVPDNTSAGMVFSIGGTQSYGSFYMGHIRNSGDGGQDVLEGDSVIGTRGGTSYGIGRLVFVTGTPGIPLKNYPRHPQEIAMVINPNKNVMVTKGHLGVLEKGKGLILRAYDGSDSGQNECFLIRVNMDGVVSVDPLKRDNGERWCPEY